MIEKLKSERGSPIHLLRCMGELTLMYLVEKLIEVDDAIAAVDYGDRYDE